MHKTILTGLRVFTAVFVASGYLALATTPSYPVAIILIPLVLFLFAPMGERLDKHFSAYRRITYWVSLIVLLVTLASMRLTGLLGAVMILVIYIQAYTIMHLKQIRNYYHLCLMSFFLLLAATAMSPEPEIGAVMFLLLGGAVIALAFLHLHREMESNPEHFTAAVLRLDERELPITPDAPKRVDLGLFAAMAGVLLLVFIVTAVLFYLTPRMQAGILGRTDPTLYRSAFTQTVELAGGGRIIPDQTAVMHVQFPDELDGRFERDQHWRISSLNEYVQSRWRRRPLPGSNPEPAFALYTTNPIYVPRNQATEVMRRPFNMGHLVHQSIYMDDVPQEGVPALTLVERMACAPGTRNAELAWDESGDFSIVLTRTGLRWLQYDAWSEIPEFTPDQLRNAQDNYKELLNPASYNTLIYQDLEPRTLDLVKQIVADKTTVYDKVLAVAAYFNSGGYAYTLNLPILPPNHPVDAFIHETKVGHCEIFSSAMALMLRSLEIPTRVVAGYRGGEWSAADRAYVVRADMAHLWVEVYFIGCGWVTFDPSPADELGSGFSRTWLARTLSRYSLKAKMAWYRNVISYDRGLQLDSLRNLSLDLVGLGSGAFERLGEVREYRGMALVALAVALLTGLAAGGAGLLLLRGRGHRTARFALTTDQARAVRLYDRLHRRLEVLGTDPRGKTAEELSHEVAATAAAEAAPAIEVLGIYNEVRFGNRPLPRDRYAQLMRTIKTFHFAKRPEGR